MASHAAKKRRPEDEVEEETHLAFRGAANALSQVYTQAVAHQKASFLAGERRAMENIYRWLSSQREQVSEVPVSDVLAYLQNEIAHRTDDMPAPLQHPNPQPHNLPPAIVQDNPFSFGNVAAALNARIGDFQTRGYNPINSFPNGKGARNEHSIRSQDFMHYNSYQPSMQMRLDDP